MVHTEGYIMKKAPVTRRWALLYVVKEGAAEHIHLYEEGKHREIEDPIAWADGVLATVEGLVRAALWGHDGTWWTWKPGKAWRCK